jgi:ATP-binding cassette, subfamily F, member 3
VRTTTAVRARSSLGRMSLLQARGITKSFGSRLILDGLDFDVEPGVRMGIIGPNGGGKSTLLRILTGAETADAGELTTRRGLVLAFLPQQLEGDDRDAMQTLRAARPDLDELESDLAKVEAQLAEQSSDMAKLTRLLRRQEEIIERWTAAGGPGFEGRARALLVDVGLDDDDLGKPTRVLSGGQRKLVGLASCLLRDPDVLLLDEPEAHLDVEAREHMEHLMRAFDGAVVAVSHDRYLLDETVSQIAELAGGRIRMWPGNYSAYTVARELELQRQQQMYVTQQKEIARLEEAIRRFKDWASRVVDERHIKQARNKQRQIDRMDKIDRPVLERRKIALDLRPHARGGERVVELTGVGVELGGNPILAGVDLAVLRGERVGVVGENGAGKSVLLRVLAAELEPDEGERKSGPSIRFGRLAQDRRPDNPKATPLQLVRHAAPISEGEAVSRLMKFLFSYEQVRRPLDSLSGGEWTRLQLLLLMLEGANCLLLDEPTNHLDIESVEMLEASLESFEGTAIFVSHDRYFLDRIADRILEVSDGGVRSYEGGWSSWRERQAVAV